MAQLILLLKERELSRHRLPGTAVRIGRDPANEVVIGNVGVSRHHATVRFEGSSVVFCDAGSQNGSYFAGKRVDQHVLREGDVLQLGKFSLKFIELGEVLQVPATASVRENRGGRDPQKTMALGPVEAANIIESDSELSNGPNTVREPAPTVAQAEGESVLRFTPIVWLAVGLVVVVLFVAWLLLWR